MENNKFNKKVMEKVRNKIVISNLEREENMKLSRRKQILSLTAVIVIMFAGSFVTVNAATNGELVEKVKDTIKVVFKDSNGKEKEVKSTTRKDSNGHIIEEYRGEDNGQELKVKVDRTNLDNENLAIDATIKDGESKIVIKERE